MKLKLQAGQSLVEIILVLALSAILLPALLTGFVASREGKVQQSQRSQALSILNETVDAVRNVREKGWNGFSANGTFHPAISGSTWVLAGGSDTIGDFTRQVVISDVYRNPPATGPIVSAGGALDPSTKKVAVTISWTLPYSSSITNTLYMTRYLDNNAFIQTTAADFSAGTLVSTVVTNTSGGEVTLGAGGGGGNWCIPTQSITTVDLSRQGVPTSVWATEVSGGGNRVFAGTGQNASGPTFTNTKVTGNSPPVASFLGEFNNTKANAVFGDGNYGYIATDSNSQEIVILDLNQFTDPPANSKYKVVGWFDSPSSTDAESIFVLGNVGYMTAGSNFYTLDLSGKTGSRLQLGTKALAGTGVRVYAVGNYAYVAIKGSSAKMQIIDVSNPASPQITGSISSPAIDSADGVDISVNSTGTRAYLATSGSSTQKEFFIINTADKSNPTPVSGGTFDTNGMNPKGVTVVTGNRAIIVGIGGTAQYQVINISNENFPQACGTGLSVPSGINSVSSLLQSDGYAYSYIVTGDTNAELKIILGGAGGQHSSAGTFTSNAFDAGYTISFNRFDATFLTPLQTTIKFQVAAANAVSGSCASATYTFIGPNLTSDLNDVFTTGGAIPILGSGAYQNPGRCFKYKVFFVSSDPSQTPELDDVTVNYSP